MARVPVSGLNRIGIQIKWVKAAIKRIEIHHHHVEAVTQVCFLALKSGGRLGHNAPLTLVLPGSMAFDAWRGGPGR